MALSGVQIVDTDRSTNLFVLMSDDGSANSAWGSVVTKFALGGGITVTAPQDAERFEHPGMDGGFTTFSRRGLGEVSWRQYVGATSEANLRLGIGRLTDLITRGGYFLRLVAGSTRLLAFEPSSIQPFSGKELELHDIYQQFAFRQGLDIKLVCQPYWEGPLVSVAGATVPMDPASGTPDVCRVFEFTASGDLPTRAKVRVQQDASSATQRIMIANRALGPNPSTDFSNYKADTGFVQLEATGRNWTATLDVDTTAQNDGADASPPSVTNVARVSYATVSDWARRVRVTRSTNLDSIRGTWDVWLRMKPSAVSTHEVKLLWGLATTNPPAFANESVTVEVPSSASNFAYYTEWNMGRITVPTDRNVTVGNLTFDIYSRRASGSGNLDLDFLWLTPANRVGTVIVPPGSITEFGGATLLTPVSNPAGGTAGAVSGTSLLLDTTTDNAGVGVSSGTVLAAGTWYVVFTLQNVTSSSATVDTGVRNITGSSYASGLITRTLPANSTTTWPHMFTANGTSAYQEQVDNPSVANAVKIKSITREFVPSLAVNEYAETDPLNMSVNRLDTSANLASYLQLEGGMPATISPGSNHLMLRVDNPADVDSAGYNRQTLARTPTVTVLYYPRYAL